VVVAGAAAIVRAVALAAAANTKSRRPVRLKDLGESHRGLLRDLTSRISNGLEAEFSELPDADGPSVGILLRERRREVLVEIPAALLIEAVSDLTAREAIRVRIKTRRDRMLFKAPPSPLPKHIVSTPGLMPFGFGRGGGPPRGRR
jgi:hypothetical protein